MTYIIKIQNLIFSVLLKNINEMPKLAYSSLFLIKKELNKTKTLLFLIVINFTIWLFFPATISFGVIFPKAFLH